LPCPAPATTCPIQPKESQIPMTCPRRSSKIVPFAEKNPDARTVSISQLDAKNQCGSCITLAIRRPVDPLTLSCNIRLIIAANATSILTLTCRTLRRRNLPTRTLSSSLPFDLSLTMGCLIARRVGISGGTTGFLCHLQPSKIGSRRRGEKKYAEIETDAYLDWAFEDFSGYVATDEVYDGPFCILSVVDNHTSKRLIFRVLDHSPKAEDILELLQSFQKILQRRELSLYGITTDGSTLYTEPVQAVFPGIRHQICDFHVKKEFNQGVFKAVTQVRRDLEKTKTKRTKRGRPTKEEKKTIQKNEKIQAKITALFDNRYLFVKKEMTISERKTLHEITKGLTELRKLRELVDEMYRLYDRRCRRATALKKLQKLRERLRRFKRLSKVLSKLESPTFDRSLHFLDDQQLPSTSNAVERGNRRFRKMQKTVYRVRTLDNIKGRIALDMFRDSRLPSRHRTIQALHDARNR